MSLTCSSLEAETDSLIIKKFLQDPDLEPKLPSKSTPDPEQKNHSGSTTLIQIIFLFTQMAHGKTKFDTAP